MKSGVEEGKNIISVYRDDVLDGGMRAFKKQRFNMHRPLDVLFEGEMGIDAGGPRREFMRLAMAQIRGLPIFVGTDSNKYFNLCADSKFVRIKLFYIK